MKKAAFHNLGCKVNAYETEVMIQELKAAGFEIVPFEETADVYIINTCTVTNIADRKSRQMLHRAKHRNPDAAVIAVGCYVQSADAEALKETGVDLAVGNNRKKDLASIVLEYLGTRGIADSSESEENFVPGDAESGRSYVPDLSKDAEYEEMKLDALTEHSRAYIKIQDGCNQFCSYCIIPFARGRIRSRKPEDIIAEITHLAEQGVKEVVLTGIHLSSYGVDFVPREMRDPAKPFHGEPGLADIIGMVHEIPGIERIRLGSLEPRIVTDEFAERIAALPKVCPHFHLSLQSGSATTLKRMNRHYSPEEYLEGVKRLRRVYADPAITTDIIVGFPQETEEEFRESVEFAETVHFYEMHIFKYSRRHGTVADRMQGQITEAVKAARSDVLIGLGEQMSAEFRERRIGTEIAVLLEEETEIEGQRYLVGFTPEYIRAAVPAEEIDAERVNTIVRGSAESLLTPEILLFHENR